MLLNQVAKKRQAISLTPLIDVVFILLLFFMLSSSFLKPRQITVSAPSEADSHTQEVIEVLLLTEQGDFDMNGQRFNVYQHEHFTHVIKQQAEVVYAVKVKHGLTTQTMVSLLDGLKQAGAMNVTLSGMSR